MTQAFEYVDGDIEATLLLLEKRYRCTRAVATAELLRRLSFAAADVTQPQA
jgi:hypothetical protein